MKLLQLELDRQNGMHRKQNYDDISNKKVRHVSFSWPNAQLKSNLHLKNHATCLRMLREN